MKNKANFLCFFYCSKWQWSSMWW